jgi:hypothetical protein
MQVNTAVGILGTRGLIVSILDFHAWTRDIRIWEA